MTAGDIAAVARASMQAEFIAELQRGREARMGRRRGEWAGWELTASKLGFLPRRKNCNVKKGATK